LQKRILKDNTFTLNQNPPLRMHFVGGSCIYALTPSSMASPFSSFANVSNDLTKLSKRLVTRPEKSLHFLVRSPDSNLHFLVSPEIALHLITG
jgi:hypothetical protein